MPRLLALTCLLVAVVTGASGEGAAPAGAAGLPEHLPFPGPAAEDIPDLSHPLAGPGVHQVNPFTDDGDARGVLGHFSPPASCEGTGGQCEAQGAATTCVTTDVGNLCLRVDRLVCATDEDCGPDSTCYRRGGAGRGLCGRCGADSDCSPPRGRCSVSGGGVGGVRRVGVCGECREHADCPNPHTHYCRRHWGATPNTCHLRLAEGAPCAEDLQCANGRCRTGGPAGHRYWRVCQ